MNNDEQNSGAAAGAAASGRNRECPTNQSIMKKATWARPLGHLTGKASLVAAAVGLVLFLICYWSRANFGNEIVQENARTTTTMITKFRLQTEDDDDDDLAVVELDEARRFAGATSLKSEKIVYCPIQKVACMEWTKVFRWMDGQPDWEVPKWKDTGLRKLSGMALERSNGMLNSPDWVKFAVVREPAERLLSCFFQKCSEYNMKNEYSNCPYVELWPDLFKGDDVGTDHPRLRTRGRYTVITEAFRRRGRTDMFREYVASIVRKVKDDPCAQNPHWAPQYCHCSLDVTAPMFNFVGFGGNMSTAAASVIVPAVTSSPRRRAEVADFIESRMKVDHDSAGKKTGAVDMVAESYSEDMLEAVRDAYAKDYELFSQYWE